MTEKFIYSLKEGKGDQKLLLEGKGANLCQMVYGLRWFYPQGLLGG